MFIIQNRMLKKAKRIKARHKNIRIEYLKKLNQINI
jgi:hypothetical protein